MSTEEKAVQPKDVKLRKRMAKHLTALVFEQVDNNGEWLAHQEYTEGLVDAALSDWRQCFEAVNKELLQALEALPLESFGEDMEAIDAAEFVDHAGEFFKAMGLAKAAIAKARAIRGQ